MHWRHRRPPMNKITEKGLIVTAPHSGAGKTLFTLGLARALTKSGMSVAPAKAGPDYIDPAFLTAAANGEPAINLDPWAMRPARIRALATRHARGADLLLIEGVMGLFDGAADGRGSTADLAAILDLPALLVIDCRRMGQSVAALATGYAGYRDDVTVAGVVLNNVASDRHEAMLRAALPAAGVPCFGAIRHDDALAIPDRHLGLVLPGAIGRFEEFIENAAQIIARRVDLDAVEALARPLPDTERATPFPPLGQRVAIARDSAFAFVYDHWLSDWAAAGAGFRLFSPLADEAPDPEADAVFLPGGYPELHAQPLAAAANFKVGLTAARDRGALIYGECGGYMVLGKSLSVADGTTCEMTGLLPLETRIDSPRRTLGYRRLSHAGPLPWPNKLTAHEFHYSVETTQGGTPLFTATDATGEALAPMGMAENRVCGSYAHVVDSAEP
jgi:cobyrinic acid a,c-diamide synthase